jgi:MtN3 and saliva related transmembrane protein
MMVSEAETVGLVAGFLVAMAYVPQVIRVWRLKDARQISLAFNLMYAGGTILWLAYGIMLALPSVMLWNGVNLVLLSTLLAVKLKYGMTDVAGPLTSSQNNAVS